MSVNPSSRQPILNVPSSVVWMLAILIGVHVVRQFLDAELDNEVILSGAFIPIRYLDGGEQLPGGLWARWTSPFTYMLLHADVVHLAMNSVWLLAFGAPVAKRIGGLGFWLFSIVTGLVGIALHLAFNWGTLGTVIGASGAVSGMTAAALRFYFAALRSGGIEAMQRNPKSVPLTSIPGMLRDRQIIVVVIIWLAINVGFGLAGSLITGGEGIAWQTHIGGFVAGLLLFGLFDRWFRGPVPRPIVVGPLDEAGKGPTRADDDDENPPPQVTYH